MRINNDCVHDILQTIEEKSTYKIPFKFYGQKSKYENLSKYDGDMLSYHLRYLLMANLVYSPDGVNGDSNGEFHLDLTPQGHNFLNPNLPSSS